MVKGVKNEPDFIVDVNPGDPLTRLTDGTAREEAEGQRHHGERPATRAEDNAGTQQNQTYPGILYRTRGSLPIDHQTRQEVVTRRAALGERPVAARTVI